jgi:hypothetical protein
MTRVSLSRRSGAGGGCGTGARLRRHRAALLLRGSRAHRCSCWAGGTFIIGPQQQGSPRGGVMDDPVLPLVLHPKRSQRLKLVLLGVAMVAVSLFLVMSSSLEARVVGAVGLALFTPGLVYALYRATKGGAALVVTREGFEDRASAIAVGFVPWAAVTDIDVVEIGRQRMVALTLRDPARVLAEVPRPKRWVLRANASFAAHVFLPQLSLPMDVEAVAEVMERARAANQRGQSPPAPD